MLKIEDYTFGKVITRTERSTVLSATNKLNLQSVVIKCYRIPSRSSKEYLPILNEIIILSKCSHPNIITLYGFSEQTHYDEVLSEDFLAIYLILEPLEVTLKSIFKERRIKNQYFSFVEIKKFIQDLFPVFCYFERNSILYQDFKPANILKSINGSYKLCDFWTSKNLFGSNLKHLKIPVEGTLAYSAPEKILSLIKTQGSFEGNPYKCESFSFGLVLLQIATLKKVKGLNTGELQAKKGILARIEEAEERYNKTLGLFLKELLENDPIKRKSLLEINKESYYELITIEDDKNYSNNSPINSYNKSISPLTLKRKGSFAHSVVSSDIQVIFQPNELRTSQSDPLALEIENLLKEAEKNRKIGNYNKSIEIYEKCFKIKWQKGIVSEDLQTSSILSGLGNVCLELQNYKKGEELHHKALIIRKGIIGESHRLIAESYNSLGVSLFGQGFFEASLTHFELAMNLYEKLLGPEHKLTALAYNNTAGGYCNIGKHEKALELRKLALGIRVRLYGEREEEVACLYDGIGDELVDMGKINESLPIRMKSYEIRLDLYGKIHQLTSLSAFTLGNCYLGLKNYEKALILGLEGLEGRIEAFGKNHVDSARSLQLVGESYKGRGDIKKAKEFIEKAWNIRKGLLGDDNEETRKCEEILKEIDNKDELYVAE